MEKYAIRGSSKKWRRQFSLQKQYFFPPKLSHANSILVSALSKSICIPQTGHLKDPALSKFGTTQTNGGSYIDIGIGLKKHGIFDPAGRLFFLLAGIVL